MKFLKIPVVAVLALLLAGALSIPASAQPAKTTNQATAEHQVTRREAQAMLSRVSQEVWHAQHSSTGYGRVQEFYQEGERAYFKGDYAEAVKKLRQASKIVKGIPNDYGND